jgi:hypothetical protein
MTFYSWLSGKVPRGFWNDLKNQRVFFEWLADQLGVKSPEDWYKVTFSDVIAKGGRGVSYYGL